MVKPVLAVGLLVAMAGAWYWALLPARAPRPARTVHGGSRAPAVNAAPAVGLDRLARLHVRSSPVWSGRDPFRGGRRESDTRRPTRDTSPGVGAAAATDIGASTPPAAEWPRLALIGLAERKDGDALERTAIISSAAGVHHARPGDMIDAVHRLETIHADGVDVRLLPEDRLVRLPLRP